MLKTLGRIVVVTIVGFASSMARAEGPFYSGSFDKALLEAKYREKIVMIDFYTTWCGPCKLLDRYTWPDKEVQDWLKENTIAIKIDANRFRPLASRYSIRSYPTMVFITPDGKELDRTVGFQQPKTFLANAGRILQRHAGRIPAAASMSQPREGRTNGGAETVEPQQAAPDPPLERMQRARQLAADGKNEVALAEMLWCFDHGDQSSPGFARVRLTTLLDEIAALGSKLPRALAELDVRRDARERELRNAAKSFAIDGGRGANVADLVPRARELAAIDRARGEPERSLRVYEALVELGDQGIEVRRAMFKDLFDHLLTRRRYEDIVTLAGDATLHVDEAIDRCRRVTSQGSSMSRRSLENLTVYLKQRVAIEGGKYYEALLGVGRYNEAQDLAQRVLDFDPSSLAYQIMIQHAVKARAYDAARELVTQAELVLRPGEMATVRRAAAAIP